MKYFTYILSLVFVLNLVFVGCTDNTDLNNNSETMWNVSGAEPVYITEWPQNEYTSQIIKPEKGKIDYIYDYSDSGRYALFFKYISAKESAEYIEKLKHHGYSEIISDGNNASSGTFLKKDDVTLSISYSEECLGIVITIENYL